MIEATSSRISSPANRSHISVAITPGAIENAQGAGAFSSSKASGRFPKQRFPFASLLPRLSFVLPGKWLAKMEESAARAIVGKCGELGASLSALANFHRRVRAAHLSLYPAGMRGVHFDFAVAQFVREMHGERISAALDAS